MIPTLRLVLITALRDRLFASLVALLAAVFAISAFLGGAAIAEQIEMAAVFIGGGSRAVVVLGLIIFIAFHVERMHETREIEAILSKSISRGAFLLSYAVAMGIIAFILTLPVAAVEALLAPHASGAFVWSCTLVLETMIVVAFTIFAGISLERAIPTIFSAIGFYVLSRLMSFFVGIVGASGGTGANAVTNPLVEFIALFVPRLDLYADTRWLVYGTAADETIAVPIFQTLIFVPLLIAAGIFDLRRKQF